MTTVWGFFYCYNNWESAPALISLHHLKKNAVAAMKKHKAEEKAEWLERKYKTRFKFGKNKDWFVEKLNVQ